MNTSKSLAATFVAASLLTAVSAVQAGATLDAIKKNGFIKCGVSDGLPGFSYADEKGNYSGIDVDVCRAVAAAVFGDATKVKFTPLTAKERFTALQSGEIDVLSRNTTWTSSRDSAQGLNFTGVTYYDGQGFLINKKTGRQERQGTGRCHGVRTGRHHHGTEPERLLPRQQDEAHPAHLRQVR